MKQRFLIGFLIWQCFLGSRAAEDWPLPPHGRVKLSPALINALAERLRLHSPAVQAREARVTAAAANAAAVRTWEDPMLMVGGMMAEREMRAAEGDLLYGVQQKLPLFGRPRAQRRLATAEADAQVAEREALFQERRRDLAVALFRVALAQRVVEIGEEDRDWLARLLQAAEEQYRVGALPQTYLLRLQNEAARRADQLLTERRQVLTALAEVNRLLGRAIDAPWPRLELPPVAGPVEYREALVRLAVDNEPNLRRRREAVRVAAAAVEVARRSRYPEAVLGVEARHFTDTGDFTQAMLTVSVSLPWFNEGRYRQDLRRERARQQAAELEVAEAELAVREEVRRLTVAIDAARRAALLYQEALLPRAGQALESARAEWMTGRVPFSDVLEARRAWLEARLQHAAAVTQQYQFLSELVLCCGLGDLESLLVIGVDVPTSHPSQPQP